MHRKFTVTDINDLGAGNVFTPTAAASCRLLDRLYRRISTIFEHQVFDRHFTDVTTQTIKD